MISIFSLIKITIVIFTTLTTLFLFYYFGSIYKEETKGKDMVYYSTIFSSFSYTFLFLIMFILIYSIITIYTGNPILCMEEVPTNDVSANSNFLGLNNNVAAAWIAATLLQLLRHLLQ